MVAQLVAQTLVGEALGERGDGDLLAHDAHRVIGQDARVDGKLNQRVANVLGRNVSRRLFAGAPGELRDGRGNPSLRVRFELRGDLGEDLRIGLAGQLGRHAEVFVGEDAEGGVVRRVERRGELGKHELAVGEPLEHHHDDFVRLGLTSFPLLEIVRHALDVASRLHLAREDALVLGGEQVDAPDLAQVHAHRVVQHLAVFELCGRRLLGVIVAGGALLARGGGQTPQHLGQFRLPVLGVAALFPAGDLDAALGEGFGDIALAIAVVAVGDAEHPVFAAAASCFWQDFLLGAATPGGRRAGRST